MRLFLNLDKSDRREAQTLDWGNKERLIQACSTWRLWVRRSFRYTGLLSASFILIIHQGVCVCVCMCVYICTCVCVWGTGTCKASWNDERVTTHETGAAAPQHSMRPHTEAKSDAHTHARVNTYVCMCHRETSVCVWKHRGVYQLDGVTQGTDVREWEDNRVTAGSF